MKLILFITILFQATQVNAGFVTWWKGLFGGRASRKDNAKTISSDAVNFNDETILQAVEAKGITIPVG
jgi:hypothetical protein